MKLLHLDSSILGDASVSREVSATIVERLRRDDPTLSVTYRDLVADPLPHLTLDALPNGAANATEAAAASQAVLDEFLAADIVVIGAPMYNFTLSSQLKAWIDRIIIAGQTFSYGPEGAKGLASAKRVIVAISRGGFYEAGNPAEHLEAYLRIPFGLIGVTPEFIVAEGVRMGDEQRATALSSAKATAAVLKAA